LLKSDLLLLTHEHADHLDIDSLPILAGNTRVKIISSPTAAEKCREMKIASEKIIPLNRGEEVSVENIRIKGIFADHGDLAPDSMGFLLEVGGMKIYFAGDTAFRPRQIAESLGCSPDIAVLPINGMYGNLHSGQAVMLAKKLGAKKVVPCHFWTFKEHNGRNGDPLSFEKIIKKKYKGSYPIFLTPGEAQIFYKEV
jgi:L-ascorbate 6-phosphate lactonase